MGAARLDRNEQILRLWPVRIAIDRMRASQHDNSDWAAIGLAINMVEAFGRATSLVRHYSHWVDYAQAAVAGAWMRHRTTGGNVFTPAELQAFEWVREDFARVLDAATMSELFKAEEYLAARTRQIMAGNKGGVRVL